MSNDQDPDDDFDPDAEFDPYDHPGEIVYHLMAICGAQEHNDCLVTSEVYFYADITQAPSEAARDDFGRVLEAAGWVYAEDGWVCPKCAPGLSHDDTDDDETD